MVDLMKLHEILEMAAAYPTEREASIEEKMLCLAKLASMGIINTIDDSMVNGTYLSIDLSSDESIMETNHGDSWRIPFEYVMSNEETTEEIEE